MIPGYGGIDLAAVVLMFLLQILNLLLIFMLRGVPPGLGSVFILSLAELLSLAINVFLGAIIIQVILSWINPGAYNPLTSLLYSLTEPLLRPARRMIPPVSGIDFSPLIVLIVLQLGKMIIIPPLLA